MLAARRSPDAAKQAPEEMEESALYFVKPYVTVYRMGGGLFGCLQASSSIAAYFIWRYGGAPISKKFCGGREKWAIARKSLGGAGRGIAAIPYWRMAGAASWPTPSMVSRPAEVS